MEYCTIVFLVFVISVFLYYKWVFSYWKRKGVQNPKPSIPFGNAYKILNKNVIFGELFKDLYDTYKPKGLKYVGFYLFTKPTLVIFDTNLIRTVLTKDFQHFTHHGNYVNDEKEPLTGTLFALKGDKWKRLRAKLNPIFSSENMKIVFHSLLESTQVLDEVMNDIVETGDVVDVKDLSAKYITDVIGTCAFGLNCNTLRDPNSKFQKFGRIMFDFNTYQSLVRFLSLTFPQIISMLGLKFLSDEASSFILNLVKDTVDFRENNNIEKPDFMHMLIKLKNNLRLENDGDLEYFKNEGGCSMDDGLTVEQIAAQALTFFLAGFETPSTTLTFCLYEIVSNDKIKKAVQEEVNAVLKKYNGHITYEGQMEMSYMDKCVHETLRKYPPLPILFRECTETYVIPETNITIEKGTRMFIPILGVHRDPEYYPDPDKFDPERFSVENRMKRDPSVWLPFGKGYRSCMGMRFGIMQVKVALTVLMKNYEFTLNSRTATPLKMSPEAIALTAKDGVWLNVKKIKHL